MSAVAVCETEEKMFCAKLDSVLDQCPRRDTLIVLGDFNAVTGGGSKSVLANHSQICLKLSQSASQSGQVV